TSSSPPYSSPSYSSHTSTFLLRYRLRLLSSSYPPCCSQSSQSAFYTPWSSRASRFILFSGIGLIIRFPSDSTILLPSALLTHSNIPIEDGETRYSIVQYALEGLLRWVYNSLRSNAEFAKTATDEEKAQHKRDEKTRWMNA
ncbi:hypothetical protein F5878DRAFT_88415, partial [Lentinula raphanica]